MAQQPGEWADKDEVIVEIESDKVTLELPAPVAGVIAEILKTDGAEAEVGEVIGRLAPQARPEGVAPPPPPPAATSDRPVVMPAAQRVLAQAGLAPAAVTGTVRVDGCSRKTPNAPRPHRRRPSWPKQSLPPHRPRRMAIVRRSG